MMAPAAMPPMIPAPTPQPRQPASAVVGTTAVRPRAAAAARAVKVLFMSFPLPSWGMRSAWTNRGFEPDSILSEFGTGWKEAGQFVGSLLTLPYAHIALGKPNAGRFCRPAFSPF